MTIAGRLTLYHIRRDHNNGTGFFRVRVDEVNQYGYGFQLRLAKNRIIGISLHTKASDE